MADHQIHLAEASANTDPSEEWKNEVDGTATLDGWLMKAERFCKLHQLTLPEDEYDYDG